MTASEFAFLALGLVLGVASGAAIVVVLGSRPPAREVKLTVEHGAVPRRAATLSSDAFTLHNEPARGGPADRRRMDRDLPESDPPPRPGFGLPGLAGVAVMTPATVFSTGIGNPASAPQVRTAVPSWPMDRPAAAAPPRAGAGDHPVMETASRPADRDPSIDALRIQAVLAAEREAQPAPPTTTAIMEARPDRGSAVRIADDTPEAAPREVEFVDETPSMIRIVRGDHRALLRTVELLAGSDPAMRRPWQAAISELAEAVVHEAIERGVLDFPVGNPFWDTFTTSQCRTIAAALAATGFRFDGIDAWADERIPTYRDLTAAVAGSGLEPRRIRAWPTQDEIGALYSEATVAADEFLTAASPELGLVEVQDLAGAAAPTLDLLWSQWDLARAVLLAPVLEPSSIATSDDPGAA